MKKMTKRVIKKSIKLLIGFVCILSILSVYKPNSLYHDQVAVITYHHIDNHESSITISSERFFDQLSHLKSNGFHFITLREFKHFLKGGSIEDNAVLVTFDDGYESFYINAYPILKKLNIPAVNFVITGDLNYPNDTFIPSLLEKEIKEMHNSTPSMDFECHTDHMHHLDSKGKSFLTTQLLDSKIVESIGDYTQRIIQDTEECRSKLTDLTQSKIDTFAYPYGAYNDKAINAIHNAGIEYAFTVEPKMVTRRVDHLRIPRINAGSPYITSDELNNSIIRRVTTDILSNNRVILRDTMEQIGGKFYRKDNGELAIYYNGRKWTLNPKTSEVNYEGTKVKLNHSLELIRNRTTIDLSDLERLLNTPIYFDTITQIFNASTPENSDFKIGSNE